MYCKKTMAFMLLAWLFIVHQSVKSQNLSNTLHVLNEVVVTSQPFREIIPSQRLSAERLEKLNSHSVADALRYFSGVQIKDYGGMGGLKTVNVRNMGSQHVGVFYDGIQLGNAQNGTVDLGKYSLDDLESIDLYIGQKSEIFQSARDFSSAASIYMKTKKPTFQANQKTNFLIKYKTTSIPLVNPSVRWEQKLSNQINFSLSSEYIKSNGRYKFRYKRYKRDGSIAYDTTAVRKNSDIEAVRLETGLYGIIANGYWDAKLYLYNSDRGLPGYIKAVAKGMEWGNGEQVNDKNMFLQTSFTRSFSHKYKMQIKAKFAYDYTHYLSRDSIDFMGENVTEKAQIDNTYYQQETYLSFVNMYSVSTNWDISFSTDFHYNKLNATLRGVGTKFSYPQRYTNLFSLASAFALGNFKLQASLVGSFVHEQVKHNNKSPDKRVFTPAIFLGYTLPQNRNVTFRLFAKRIFRMPTFNDLYYSQIGYSSLKPEYTNQYNLGFSILQPIDHNVFQEISFQTDCYYLNVTDKIIASPTGSQFRWMMTNTGKMKGQGLDMTGSLIMKLGCVKTNLNLTYSYSKMQDYQKVNDNHLSSYRNQIPYTPWHSGSVIINGQYNTWGLNYGFVYVGKRYDGAVNNIPKNKIEPWYTNDLSLQKEFRYKYHKIKGSIEVNNLFDQQYEVVLNYPMPGRNYKFILSIEL